MRVVVDTNVWVSGLLARDTPPVRVVRAVRGRELDLVCSVALVEEMAEVLARPAVRALGVAAADVEDVLQLVRPFVPRLRRAVMVPRKDPTDVHLIEAAVAGGADAIVTGDGGLLRDHELRAWLGEREIELLTPAQLLERQEPG